MTDILGTLKVHGLNKEIIGVEMNMITNLSAWFRIIIKCWN